MRLGGPARYVLEVTSPQEVADAYGFAEQFRLRTFPLGYGANTLGHDEGFNGAIIINRMQGIADDFTADGARLKVMGGEYWDNVVAHACEKGLTGIEALSKIPGLAGSAPVQNIGAYGQQLSDTLESVDVYDTASRTFRTLTKENLHFDYRQSIFNTTERGRYFIISITLKLTPGEMPRPFYNSLERYIDDHSVTDFSPQSIRQIVSAIRDTKLPDPLKVASAGSFFHNIYISDEEAEKAIEKGYPMHRGKDGNKISAAWLIEQAGFKGKLLHGIRVSDKAPLVLINESAKSYNDLEKAREEIVGHVYDKFGWWLEQEPVELQ
ncbi:UDP-N-acetylmuramate dehydrogenase [Candidatus Saccharibacteria bacterium]|nr:UDP-N-acetylmuramate dehydrogenase [Candidatus Saccharibacteria bacterium]